MQQYVVSTVVRFAWSEEGPAPALKEAAETLLLAAREIADRVPDTARARRTSVRVEVASPVAGYFTPEGDYLRLYEMRVSAASQSAATNLGMRPFREALTALRAYGPTDMTLTIAGENRTRPVSPAKRWRVQLQVPAGADLPAPALARELLARGITRARSRVQNAALGIVDLDLSFGANRPAGPPHVRFAVTAAATLAAGRSGFAVLLVTAASPAVPPPPTGQPPKTGRTPRSR